MIRKQKFILVVGMATAVLTACSNEKASVPDTYRNNTTPVESDAEQNNADSEYEINDMLPELSDDTLIMSVEEAEKFMSDRANMYSDVYKETESE